MFPPKFTFLLLLPIGVSLLLCTRGPGFCQAASPPDPGLEVPTPASPEGRLTLSQAVQVGLRDNPQTAASHYAVVSAHENYNSQKAPINPTVNYSAINSTVAPFDFVTGFALRSNYSAYATLETNGAIRYRTAQAREQLHQAQFDADTATLLLKLNLVTAYVGLQTANRALDVERQVYAAMKQIRDLTQKRFEIGSGPQADAIRARIAAVQEEQNLIADVAAVNAARAQLNQWLGHPQETLVDAADPLVYRPVAVPDPVALTRLAERSRPDLLSAKAALRALQAVPGLQRSEYYPNVVLGRDFGKDSPLGIGMVIPLDLGGIRGAVRKAQADVRVQEAQVELIRQGVDQDVKSAFIALDAARKQVDSYESGLLKQSETLLDQVRQGYLLGANTILDVVTAENTYRSVESAYIAAVGAYEQAVYTLEHAVGVSLDTHSMPPSGGLPASPGGVEETKKP